MLGLAHGAEGPKRPQSGENKGYGERYGERNAKKPLQDVASDEAHTGADGQTNRCNYYRTWEGITCLRPRLRCFSPLFRFSLFFLFGFMRRSAIPRNTNIWPWLLTSGCPPGNAHSFCVRTAQRMYRLIALEVDSFPGTLFPVDRSRKRGG